MSTNLLEIVQQNLGYPALKKQDPNMQTALDETTSGEDRFSQAAIPAMITGLFKYVQSDEGATDFLSDIHSANWVTKVFEENRQDAVKTICAYADQSDEAPLSKMNSIAVEAVKVVKENLAPDAGIKELKIYFKDQIKHILLYLPAELNMGGLLHDTTLDDNTNKMEGPISSLMQAIGGAFSSPVTGEDVKKV